jgi:hypothetical protein
MREKCWLRIFENRMLRIVLRYMREEVTRQWRRLRNEELYISYSSLYIVRVMKLIKVRRVGHVARIGEKR